MWTRNAGETGALFVHDLASGTTSQLTAEVAGSVASSLDGPRLVYGQGLDTEAELLLYDFRTGATTTMTDNDLQDTCAQIAGGAGPDIFAPHNDINRA